MRVMFKLSGAQIERAREARRVGYESQKEGFDALKPFQLCHRKHGTWKKFNVFNGYNTEQALTIDKACEVLCYRGHRNALLKDGLMDTILWVLSGSDSAKPSEIQEPYEYNTSDRRLAWYETLEMHMQSKVFDIVKVVEDVDSNPRKAHAQYDRQTLITADKAKKIIMKPGRVNYKELDTLLNGRSYRRYEIAAQMKDVKEATAA